MMTNHSLRILLTAGALVPWQARAETAPADPPAVNPTPATNDDTNVLKEIVVTAARRRNEAAQTTPIAIAAIGSAQLERNAVNNIVQIEHLTPNLSIHRQQGAGGGVGIYLRGFGVQTNAPTANPAIAIFVDGVYQGQVNGNQLDLFDLQSIEVLKGPQGTLLGKNAPSGAISVTTKRPSGEFGAEGQLTYARFNRLEARGLIEAPIVKDVISAKVSVLYEHGGNYAPNYSPSAVVPGPVAGQTQLNTNGPISTKLGGRNIFSIRGGLLVTPGPDVDWYTSFNYTRDNSHDVPLRYIGTASGAAVTPISYPTTLPAVSACSVYGFCTPLPRYTGAADYTPRHNIRSYNLSSTMNWRTGPVVLTSVTGYQHWTGSNDSDSDGSPFPVISVRNAMLNFTEVTQELRLSSEKNGGLDLDGKLDWVAGLYYYGAHFNDTLPLELFGGSQAGGVSLSQYERGRDRSYAAFAHAEYKITPKWAVSFGARQTWDNKRHAGVEWVSGTVMPPLFTAQKKWSNFSVEAGTSYKFDPDKMVYFRFAEGYRGGGMQNYPVAQSGNIPYNPETVKSFEVGAKTEWFNHRLRANIDVFRSDYSDLQRSIFINNVLQAQNAASARIEGVEADLIAVPIKPLTLRGSLGYIKAKYLSYFTDVVGAGITTDNSSFHFPYTPKWNYSLGADYIVFHDDLGKLTASADYSWRDKQTLQILDVPVGRQKAYGLVNLSLRYDDPSGRFNVSVYGQNILNKYYFTNVEVVNNLTTSATEGEPATWGVRVGFKF